MSWWNDGIIARETVYFYTDLPQGVEGWIIRWDTGWGYPAVSQADEPEAYTPERRQQWAIDAAFFPDAPEKIKLDQRQHALLQLQRVACREGFGHLCVPPVGRTASMYPGFQQQYVQLVAQPATG